MTSSYLSRPQPIKFKIRSIGPVSQHHPCFLDLNAHPYHIYHASMFMAAFSSIECAQHSIELGLIKDCPAEDRYGLIQSLKIIDIVSGLEYRRLGSTWEPINASPNMKRSIQ